MADVALISLGKIGAVPVFSLRRAQTVGENDIAFFDCLAVIIPVAFEYFTSPSEYFF
jgi:hypothetical protein